MNLVLETLNYEVPAERYEHSPVSQDLIKFIADNADPVVTVFWLTNPGVYICGGTMRAFYAKANGKEETVNDIDLYFADQAIFDSFLAVMEKNYYTPAFESERAISFNSKTKDGPAIQAIQYVMGTIEEVLGEFDFTVVKCGASSSEVVMHQSFKDALEKRLLVYCGSRLPLSSLNRAFKYTARGYWLPAVQMIAILADINGKIDLNDVEQVIYHLESFDPYALPEVEIKEDSF